MQMQGSGGATCAGHVSALWRAGRRSCCRWVRSGPGVWDSVRTGEILSLRTVCEGGGRSWDDKCDDGMKSRYQRPVFCGCQSGTVRYRGELRVGSLERLCESRDGSYLRTGYVGVDR
ncbi:hypothetical protein L226DRAFT_222712 [Lentinus tigrinus ALCF2SS1-7]|uniref:Cyanovirin-N domain-containing protein n=1 Tax=Lentinus tigrinus ALCF2SS1-6 TaxID=1328759 RepID=A0A5C2RV79_9APHY|nr:hypothetical protein L227DRAFT_306446 [Lentinus tigrinus ALCF2SS1-6]RPD70643.1 hypothetical protein L226DRAFT_222712 [Lentinus tigrinus ALCF2SS1-7]